MLERIRFVLRPGIWVAATMLLLVAVALLHPLSEPVRPLAEGGVYLLVALACASAAPVRRVARRIGGARLAVLGAVLVAAMVVQVFKLRQQTYPLVRWTMYSGASPQPLFPRFDAVLASGASVPFPFAELTPGTSPRAFLAVFSVPLYRMHTASDTVAAGFEAELHGLISHMVEVYNRRGPADPIVAARGGMCRLPLHDYRGPDSVSCDFRFRYDRGAGGVP